MCPAVPTVSATSSRSHAVRAATARADLVDLAVGERAHVEQQPAVAHDPDDGRLAGAQRIEQRLLDRAGEARQLRERKRAAADPGHRLLDLAADEAREALGPLPHGGDRLGEHPQHRDLAAGALGIESEGERALERGERQLVRAQRALQRMPAQALDQVGAAGEDAGLRPAEQLVAREADEVGSRGEARRGGRLVADRRERARAEIVDERQPGPLRERRPDRTSSGCSVKPTTRKFDWCTRRMTAVSGPIARS